MLIDLPLREFLADLRQLPGLDVAPMTLGDAEDALARRASIGTLLLSDGAVFALRLPAPQLAEQARTLKPSRRGIHGARRNVPRGAHGFGMSACGKRAAERADRFPRFQPDEIRHLRAEWE